MQHVGSSVDSVGSSSRGANGTLGEASKEGSSDKRKAAFTGVVISWACDDDSEEKQPGCQSSHQFLLPFPCVQVFVRGEGTPPVRRLLPSEVPVSGLRSYLAH